MPKIFSKFSSGLRPGAKPSVGVQPIGSSQYAGQTSSSTAHPNPTQLSQSQRMKPQLGGKGIYARGAKVGSGGKGLGGKVGGGIGGTGMRRHR